VVFFAILAGAAIYDYKTFTIPHGFTYAVMAVFVVAAISTGLSLPAWGWHFLSGVIAFIAALILFIAGLMGGGDVKLFGAIGLWWLPAGLPGLIFCVTICGAALSILYLFAKTFEAKSPGQSEWSLIQKFKAAKSERLAYGPAITAGTIIYYLLST